MGIVVSALGTASDIASIMAGLAIPSGAVFVWFARKWVHGEIVSKLSNDDTPVAKYAHDARDYAKQALDTAVNTNTLIANHVTNTEMHRVHI